MKPYTDVFGKALDKGELETATRQLVLYKKSLNATFLMRRMKMGYGKAARIIELLEDAGVLGPLMSGRRSLLLKNEAAAVNAALRQLKKGKKK